MLSLVSLALLSVAWLVAGRLSEIRAADHVDRSMHRPIGFVGAAALSCSQALLSSVPVPTESGRA
jgi:hypothetical protein